MNKTTNDERKLVVPGIYRHFKNKLYCTIGKSIMDKNAGVYAFAMYATHTETKERIRIYTDGYGYVHDPYFENGSLVLYKSLYDDTAVYARPLDMFLSKTDKEKYPNAIQEYRMELVGGMYDERIIGIDRVRVKEK